MSSSKQKGFTLVELMLAMAFFSFILLFATSGFILINRAYNKGLTVKLVQDEARSTIEKFSREIRAATGIIVPSGGENCVTVGNDSYYWTDKIIATASTPTRLMWVEGVPCSAMNFSVEPAEPSVAAVPPAPPIVPVSVLNDRVGVQSIEFTRPTVGNEISITLLFSTIEPDLIDTTGEPTCKAVSGSQYCDLVKLTTVVSAP